MRQMIPEYIRHTRRLAFRLYTQPNRLSLNTTFFWLISHASRSVTISCGVGLKADERQFKTGDVIHIQQCNMQPFFCPASVCRHSSGHPATAGEDVRINSAKVKQYLSAIESIRVHILKRIPYKDSADKTLSVCKINGRVDISPDHHRIIVAITSGIRD